jgi:hypothetical protein
MVADKGPASLRPRCTRSGSSIAAIQLYGIPYCWCGTFRLLAKMHEKRTLSGCMYNIFCFHHMSLMDFVVSPLDCGRSVTDLWGWDAHKVQLRCPDEVDGDIWIWSTRRGRNLSSTKLPRPWSPWESSPSRKNPHGRTGNRTQHLMIIGQKLWPLDHEVGHMYNIVFLLVSVSWWKCVEGRNNWIRHKTLIYEVLCVHLHYVTLGRVS